VRRLFKQERCPVWVSPRANWRALSADLMRRKRIKPGQFVGVRLTTQERDLILERTFIDDEMGARLRGAAPHGSRLVVQLTLDDIERGPDPIAWTGWLSRFAIG
jgi:hypothetical protein